MPSNSRKPPLQLFVSRVLRQFSITDPSVSDGQIIMEAFRSSSIPPSQLKSIAKAASPEQLSLLLGVVPADHLKELIASIPSEALRSEAAPVAETSPPNVAPATILQTTYTNTTFDISNPDWAKNVCGGSTIGLSTPLSGNGRPFMTPALSGKARWRIRGRADRMGQFGCQAVQQRRSVRPSFRVRLGVLRRAGPTIREPTGTLEHWAVKRGS